MTNKRKLIIGDEWFYVKIYIGAKLTNELIHLLLPLLRGKESYDFDRFFFIRYADPYSHLRIRFHLSSERNATLIIKYLHKKLSPLVENGIIRNIQCETYNREIERYTSIMITQIEDIFCIDSENIVKLLQLSPKSEDLLRIAVIMADQYMTLFNMDMQEKYVYTNTLSISFLKEFKIENNRAYTKQFNDKYRVCKDEICQILISHRLSNARYNNIIGNAVERLKEKLSEIQNYFDKKTNGIVESRNLLVSIMHMFFNRLFSSDNRINEFVIYYFLSKSYNSLIQQMKYGDKY